MIDNYVLAACSFAHQFLDTSLYTKDFDFESIRVICLLCDDLC